ncbi:AAA family ATPase [Qipengyuania flava]|uniref:ATP-binding protein n=1 Tax=Qipengyuania flava TaxID=192812 RepID=UPI001ADA3069|nr:ATP-binding protein [Qipengyuania flava]MBO9505386.1 AAA family ATPase [Qipengyuania flava]
MNWSRKIVALAGLSGSGKTTVIGAIEKAVDFDHFSASELLKQHAGKTGAVISSEELRLGDIDANQIALVEAFLDAASETRKDIIFDCHSVIDGADGIQEIPSEVFRAIGITDMAFLSVAPQELMRRRSSDRARGRPRRSVRELAAHQSIAIEAAIRISEDCCVHFTDIGSDPEQMLVALLG